ncbi:unnamed protein product [Dictyota dichotoma]
MVNKTKRTLSLLIEKDPGILLRILSLITRRRFNLETLTIGNCEDNNYRRLILIISNEQQGSDEAVFQLIKQLGKLINIINIRDISNLPLLERELMLVRLKTTIEEQQKILQLSKVLKFNILDLSETTICLEMIGDSNKIEKYESILKNYEVIELVKTGKIALVEKSPISNQNIFHNIKTNQNIELQN